MTTEDVCIGCEGESQLLSVCCGAPEHSKVENLCSACLDWTGFEHCPECGGPDARETDGEYQ